MLILAKCKMNSTKISLSLYISSSLITLIAVIFDMKWIEFIVKPFILPTVFFYYFQNNENKFSVVLLFLLIINFISDMTAVIDNENKKNIIIVLNLICNITLIYLFIKDAFKLKTVERKNILQFVFFLTCFLAITYIFLTLISGLYIAKMVYYIIYGFVLSFMTTISIQNSIISNNLRSFYSMLVSVSFVMTDTFYVLYYFYLPMKIFLVVNLAVQFGSYFYLIKYFSTSQYKEIEYGNWN